MRTDEQEKNINPLLYIFTCPQESSEENENPKKPLDPKALCLLNKDIKLWGCNKTKGLGQGAVDCGTVIGNIWGKLMEDRSYFSRCLYRPSPCYQTEPVGSLASCTESPSLRQQVLPQRKVYWSGSQTRSLEFKLNLCL